MTTLLHISISLSPLCALHLHEARTERQRCCGLRLPQPFCCPSLLRTKIGFLHQKRFKLGVCRERWSFLEVREGKDGILVREEGWRRRKKVVLVKSNQGFGGGGGGRDNGGTARLLGNLALAIGLTYLSVTGQIGLLFDAIGWVFDVVVSLSVNIRCHPNDIFVDGFAFDMLLCLLVHSPKLYYGPPVFHAIQYISVCYTLCYNMTRKKYGSSNFILIQNTDPVFDSLFFVQCPNCGNDFKIFRSAVNNDLQLCPFCTQPFSVVGNKFVSDPVNFSNKSTTFGEAFNNFSSRSSKGKDFSSAVVDIEAEVTDLD
ncbi:hypothetical protein RHGRI_009594 [Rhododendron griersonianum]|uniref:Uncharacterized protein n=1 Tax=Rhododendron griersonianum TaxID=479676 RepID=A0AAV6KFZ2_9ERIC|nr:hypothetical protein RHGRI_009594 [Rhododendron griersonianum]KAG5551219.1 hypothetical protein RHGRI_009594 [Rhododendron griersonianum]